MIVAMVASYWLILVVLPLVAIFMYARHYYVRTARQIKKLEISGVYRFSDIIQTTILPVV